MRRIFICLLLIAPLRMTAQVTNGPIRFARTFSNPSAAVLQTDMKGYVHILSADTWASAGTASISWSSVFSQDFLRTTLLGTAKPSSGFAGLDLQGPGFGIRIGEKNMISLGTRSRLLNHFSDLNGRLIAEIGEITHEQHEYPYEITPVPGMQINTAVFSELALSLSRILVENHNFKLSGGASVKYVNGVAQSTVQVGNLSGRIDINKDKVGYLTAASGQISTRTAGNFLSGFHLNDFVKTQNGSIGADLGLSMEISRGSHPDRKFALQIAVTDIGSMSYSADSMYSKSYDVRIADNRGLYFNNNFDNGAFSHSTEVFDKYPQFFKKKETFGKTYKAGLPTMLRLDSDYDITSGLALSANLGIDLRKEDQTPDMHNYSYAGLTIGTTKKALNVSIPVFYQKYAGLNCGLGIRHKGFAMGSRSLFSAALGSRQLDFFMGYTYITGR